MKQILRSMIVMAVIVPLVFVMVACGGNGRDGLYKLDTVKIDGATIISGGDIDAEFLAAFLEASGNLGIPFDLGLSFEDLEEILPMLGSMLDMIKVRVSGNKVGFVIKMNLSDMYELSGQKEKDEKNDRGDDSPDMTISVEIVLEAKFDKNGNATKYKAVDGKEYDMPEFLSINIKGGKVTISLTIPAYVCDDCEDDADEDCKDCEDEFKIELVFKK